MIEELLNKYDKVYPISISLPGAGFGAILLTTLNQLRFCERQNYYPIVHYDESCHNAFFDKKYGNNFWTQYFEPVSALSFDELQKLKLPKDRIFSITSLSAIKISEESIESIYPYPFGKWRFQQPEDLDTWYQQQRQKGRETVNQYITPKLHIRKLVENYYEKYLQGSTVLGIHIRGTDLHYAPPVSPAEYFMPIENYLSHHPNTKIFVATDQKQYIAVFQKRFGEIVCFSNSFRSDNAIAPFNRPEISPYQKGEDVLIDILILAKSDFLIKGVSNVGEMALYFNNQLTCLDLGYNKIKAFGQRYDAAWDNMTNSSAWVLVSKNNLHILTDNAYSQSPIQELYYEIRKIAKRCRVILGLIRHKLL